MTSLYWVGVLVWVRCWGIILDIIKIFRKHLTHYFMAWWRHQMETFSALLVICAGNSPVPGEFPTQRPVTRSFDAYFDLRPNKRLSKQSWDWCFETLSLPLWRHRNGQGVFLLQNRHPYPHHYLLPSWSQFAPVWQHGKAWVVKMNPMPWSSVCNTNYSIALTGIGSTGKHGLVNWTDKLAYNLKRQYCDIFWRKAERKDPGKCCCSRCGSFCMRECYAIHYFFLTFGAFINPLRPSDAYMQTSVKSVKIGLDNGLFVAKSLPEPVGTYCQLDP